jgi:hypothetical protein
MISNYIYRHIRLDTNEPFYIGIGSGDTYKRAFSKLNRSSYWITISKSGYKVDILMDNLSRDQASEKEKEFIKLYGRQDLKTGSLCNLTLGGDNNYVMAENTKEKIRRSHKGLKQSPESIEKRAIKLRGQKRSKEFCEKIRLVHLGSSKPSLRRKRPEISNAKKQKVLNTETNEIYNSVKEFGLILKLSPRKCIKLLRDENSFYKKLKT